MRRAMLHQTSFFDGQTNFAFLASSGLANKGLHLLSLKLLCRCRLPRRGAGRSEPPPSPNRQEAACNQQESEHEVVHAEDLLPLASHHGEPMGLSFCRKKAL
jgi:hypothetical protein